MNVQALPRFRKNLQVMLEVRGFSQRELAALAGVSYPYVNRILQGKVQPTIASADKISDALNMPLPKMLLPEEQFIAEVSAGTTRQAG